jgi:hypothetical protein
VQKLDGTNQNLFNLQNTLTPISLVSGHYGMHNTSMPLRRSTCRLPDGYALPVNSVSGEMNQFQKVR